LPAFVDWSLQVDHVPICLNKQSIEHFGQDQVDCEIQGNQLVKQQVEAHECLEHGQLLVDVLLLPRKEVPVLVPVVIEPEPGANLRHQDHLRDHDNEIHHQKDIELVRQGTDLEFVLALIQDLFRVLTRVDHQGIHITRVLEKCTTWNKLLQI
jgi:hypothetical protein